MLITKKNALLLLIFAFLVSIAIRIPNLNRPLSKHHEFNMAMVLNVCNSWQLQGGSSLSNFCPVINYGSEGDVYYGEHDMVKDGKLYYASLGPLQFLLPYYFCTLLHLPYTPINVQVFSILMEFITIIILFQLLLNLFYKNVKQIYLSLMGTLLFLFLPNILWFFSNGYVHETVVLPFYFLVVNFFILQFVKQKILTNAQFFALLVCIFFGIQADWFMAILASFYCLYFIFICLKNKSWNKITSIGLIVISIIFSIFSIYYFYSKQLGHTHFINLFVQKFQSRTISNASDKNSNTTLLISILKNIISSYLPLLIALVVLIIINLKKLYWKTIFFIILLPPIFYNVLLLEFSAENDYAFLKFSLFFIIAFLFYFQKVKKNPYAKLTLALLFITCSCTYYYINKPGIKSRNGDLYNEFKNIGTFIKQNVKSKEVIFTNLAENNLQAVMYYAKRNIRNFTSFDELKNHIFMHKIKNAIYITNDKFGNFFLINMIDG